MFSVLFLTENTILAVDNLLPGRAVLGLKVPSFKQPLKFVYENKVLEVRLDDVTSPERRLVFSRQALEYGHQGSIVKKFLDQNRAVLGLVHLKSTALISQNQLNLKILEIQNLVNVEARPIRPDFALDLNKTLPAEDGKKLNVNVFTRLVADNLFAPPEKPLLLPTLVTFTTHREAELTPIRKLTKELLAGGPIKISSGSLVFTLNPSDIQSLLTLVERPDVKDPKRLSLVLRLDDIKLNRKLGDYAQEVEKVTGAEFDDHDARVAIYAQFYAPENRHLLIIPTGQKLASNNQVLGSQTVAGEKRVYLTFDDGPNSIYHPMILDILKAENVKATFFLVGQNAVKDDPVARRTVAEEHIIGNHSNTHSFLPKLSAKNVFDELTTANKILKPINHGKDVTLFRPPYGGVNLSVKQYADNLGLKLYLWDVDPRDWSEPSVDELVRRVVGHIHPGADVLLHSNHLVTVQALPKIIETLKKAGYSFDQLN